MSNPDSVTAEEIVACPECGGLALSELVFERHTPIGYRIACTECEKCGPTCSNESFAVAVWNEAAKS